MLLFPELLILHLFIPVCLSILQLLSLLGLLFSVLFDVGDDRVYNRGFEHARNRLDNGLLSCVDLPCLPSFLLLLLIASNFYRRRSIRLLIYATLHLFFSFTHILRLICHVLCFFIRSRRWFHILLLCAYRWNIFHWWWVDPLSYLHVDLIILLFILALHKDLQVPLLHHHILYLSIIYQACFCQLSKHLVHQFILGLHHVLVWPE